MAANEIGLSLWRRQLSKDARACVGRGTDLFDHVPLIYVIAGDAAGPTKIGVTKRLANRVSELQHATYQPLRIYGVRFAAGRPSVSRHSMKDCFRIGAEALEKAVHAKLKEMDFHIRGEWFDISAADGLAVVDKVGATEGPLAVGLEKLLGADLTGRSDKHMERAHAVMVHEALAINTFIKDYNQTVDARH